MGDGSARGSRGRPAEGGDGADRRGVDGADPAAAYLACAAMTCRLGVLALGDSITNGGGELQWGVALQSWALWVARGLALPYTGLATDGARVGDVLAEQVPHVPADARYDLGCLYVGVNDVRALDWGRAAFERGHRQALEVLRARCD